MKIKSNEFTIAGTAALIILSCISIESWSRDSSRSNTQDQTTSSLSGCTGSNVPLNGAEADISYNPSIFKQQASSYTFDRFPANSVAAVIWDSNHRIVVGNRFVPISTTTARQIHVIKQYDTNGNWISTQEYDALPTAKAATATDGHLGWKSVKSDRFGNYWIAGNREIVDGSIHEIHLRRSSNNGNSWGADVVLKNITGSSFSSDAMNHIYGNQAMVVSPIDGRLFIVGQTSTGFNTGFYASFIATCLPDGAMVDRCETSSNWRQAYFNRASFSGNTQGFKAIFWDTNPSVNQLIVTGIEKTSSSSTSWVAYRINSDVDWETPNALISGTNIFKIKDTSLGAGSANLSFSGGVGIQKTQQSSPYIYIAGGSVSIPKTWDLVKLTWDGTNYTSETKVMAAFKYDSKVTTCAGGGATACYTNLTSLGSNGLNRIFMTFVAPYNNNSSTLNKGTKFLVRQLDDTGSISTIDNYEPSSSNTFIQSASAWAMDPNAQDYYFFGRHQTSTSFGSWVTRKLTCIRR